MFEKFILRNKIKSLEKSLFNGCGFFKSSLKKDLEEYLEFLNNLSNIRNKAIELSSEYFYFRNFLLDNSFKEISLSDLEDSIFRSINSEYNSTNYLLDELMYNYEYIDLGKNKIFPDKNCSMYYALEFISAIDIRSRVTGNGPIYSKEDVEYIYNNYKDSEYFIDFTFVSIIGDEELQYLNKYRNKDNILKYSWTNSNYFNYDHNYYYCLEVPLDKYTVTSPKEDIINIDDNYINVKVCSYSNRDVEQLDIEFRELIDKYIKEYIYEKRL